jgi:nucleoside-diphosphate-sugar epimerase
MRALVTGGTGFIGGALVDRLLTDGWETTLLVRDPARVAERHQGRVETVTGDLAAELPALPASDVVFHCAADMQMGHSMAEMRRVTEAGTQRLLMAVRKAGCGRFVHVSSQAVYGFDRHYYDADEATPMRRSPYPYCESKRLAELAVWDAHKLGLEAVVLRPGFVYGPGDRHSLPPVVQAIQAGQLSAHIDWGEFDSGCVHVENLVDALVLAATVPGASGHAYHVGDGRILTIRHLSDTLCDRLGLQAPAKNMPFPLAMALGAVVEGAWALLRMDGPPPMSRFLVAMLRRNSGFSIAKARRELGYKPRRQWEEGLDELSAYLRPYLKPTPTERPKEA